MITLVLVFDTQLKSALYTKYSLKSLACTEVTKQVSSRRTSHDIFLVIPVLKLEQVSPTFPFFIACLERKLSRPVATDDRKQFKWLNIAYVS